MKSSSCSTSGRSATGSTLIVRTVSCSVTSAVMPHFSMWCRSVIRNARSSRFSIGIIASGPYDPENMHGMAPIRAMAHSRMTMSMWLALRTATRSHGRTPAWCSQAAARSTRAAHSV